MVSNKPSDGLDEVLHRVEEASLHENRRTVPGVEIIEEPNAFVLSCDLPTAEREDIRVDVSPHRVVIAATARPLDAFRPRTAGQDPYPAFERAIPLPAEVDPETAEARLNNGVLEVTLPKRTFGGMGVYTLPSE